MSEEERVMEKVLRRLDEEGKGLEKENGESLLEKLGVGMEQVYRNEGDLLEEGRLEDGGKGFELG
ncbi:hypothetical protein [Staphylococcus pettenkoferi]|uniref:hypothetical protein n=1 Tax=Staphylococcus pettenkoferi TaxID=170573 RepID=UPI00119D1750|nr:hypothetical protein [Staphylococcus pettenkoferi]